MIKNIETSINQIAINLKDPKKIKEKLVQLGVSGERIEEVLKSIKENKVVKSAGIQDLVSRMRNHMVVNVLTHVDEIRKNAVKQVTENSRNLAGQLQSLVKTKRVKRVVKTSATGTKKTKGKKLSAKKANAKKTNVVKAQPKTKATKSKRSSTKTKRTSK